MLKDVLSEVLPPLINAIVPLLVTAILVLVQRWTGIVIEAHNREALQSALLNAARLMILQKNGSIDQAIDYVQRSVPDALATFKIADRGRIAELLQPHILALSAAGDPSLSSSGAKVR